MKARSLALLLLLPLAMSAAEVQLGGTLGDVRAALGVPRGQMQAGDRHLLYYDRGEVELTAGKVTRVNLLTEQEFAAQEIQRAARAERIREENASQLATGETVKARQLASATFQNAPPAYQVAFWENFMRQYPGVNCVEQLTIARMSLAEQLESKRAMAEQDARLAELEARVASAEAQNSSMMYYGDTYGSYYGGYYPYRTYSQGYSRRSYYGGYHSVAPNLCPVAYHFNDYPVMATSIARLPAAHAAYHGTPQWNNNSNCGWRNGPRIDHRGEPSHDFSQDRRGSSSHYRL